MVLHGNMESMQWLKPSITGCPNCGEGQRRISGTNEDHKDPV